MKKHKDQPLCGECRQPKGKPHRIFLDLEDLVDDQVALVVDGLNTINMECSSSEVEAFNQAVRKLYEKPGTDPAVSVSKTFLPYTNYELTSFRMHCLKL